MADPHEIQRLLKEMEKKMEASVQATQEELTTIRTGVANAALLNHLQVDAYGTKMRLPELATVSTPEPRLLMITPWDRSLLQAIERSIMTSDLGLNPSDDGAIIRLAIPPLTEERRHELAKVVGKRAEEGKVAVRNVRRDAVEHFRHMEKNHKMGEDELHRLQNEIQKTTDRYIAKLDELRANKEKEILHS